MSVARHRALFANVRRRPRGRLFSAAAGPARDPFSLAAAGRSAPRHVPTFSRTSPAPAGGRKSPEVRSAGPEQGRGHARRRPDAARSPDRSPTTPGRQNIACRAGLAARPGGRRPARCRRGGSLHVPSPPFRTIAGQSPQGIMVTPRAFLQARHLRHSSGDVGPPLFCISAGIDPTSTARGGPPGGPRPASLPGLPLQHARCVRDGVPHKFCRDRIFAILCRPSPSFRCNSRGGSATLLASRTGPGIDPPRIAEGEGTGQTRMAPAFAIRGASPAAARIHGGVGKALPPRAWSGTVPFGQVPRDRMSPVPRAPTTDPPASSCWPPTRKSGPRRPVLPFPPRRRPTIVEPGEMQ